MQLIHIYERTPERALFIAAHPDDIEFVAAGTAAKWAAAGADVRYVLVTRGDAGSHDLTATRERIAEVRMAEQRAAAQVTGVQEVLFLAHPDGAVEPTLNLRRELVREIRRFRPEVMVCFDPTQVFIRDDYVNHPDHRAVGQAALDAACPAAAMPLIFADLKHEGLAPHRVKEILVATGYQPNCWVDISATLEVKLRALRCHGSQFASGWDPAPLVRNWATEAGSLAGLSHAESFRRIVWPRP